MIQETHPFLRGVQVLLDLLTQVKIKSIQFLDIVHDLVNKVCSLVVLSLCYSCLFLLQVGRKVGNLVLTELLILCEHLM